MSIKKKAAMLQIEYDSITASLNNIGTQMLKLAFEVNDDIETITLFGYTPSFNDGDVCEHSQEEYYKVNGVYFNDDYNDFEDDEDAKGIKLTKAQSEQLTSILSAAPVVSFLERTEGTNWEITLSLKNDELNLEKEYRDSDY